jgi:phosphomannomutase
VAGGHHWVGVGGDLDLELVRCSIYRVDDGGSRRQGAAELTPLPQRLRNCRLNGGRPLAEPSVQQCIEAARLRLGDRGRLLVRPSGTEPLVRVMVEADDEDLLEAVLVEVSGTIERYA